MTLTWFRAALPGTLACIALGFIGCGTVQEGTTEEEWTSVPPVSVTARLEYRIDSLTNENRRMRQQLDAMQTENTNLNARLAELQSKPAESTPRPSSTPAVTPAVSAPTHTVVTPGYESALSRFRRKDFHGAIDEFNGLIKGGVSDDLVDNCHYWIGESNFALKKYTDAIQAFEIVAGMAGSDKADDAQFMIGNSYAAMEKKAEAKDALQKLVTLYPTSPLAKRAKAKMNGL